MRVFNFNHLCYTHMMLYNSSSQLRAQNSRQRSKGVTDTHQHTGVLWSDIKMIHKETAVYKSIHSNRQSQKYHNYFPVPSVANDYKCRRLEEETWKTI